jgi:amino acid transporter
MKFKSKHFWAIVVAGYALFVVGFFVYALARLPDCGSTYECGIEQQENTGLAVCFAVFVGLLVAWLLRFGTGDASGLEMAAAGVAVLIPLVLAIALYDGAVELKAERRANADPSVPDRSRRNPTSSIDPPAPPFPSR